MCIKMVVGGADPSSLKGVNNRSRTFVSKGGWWAIGPTIRTTAFRHGSNPMAFGPIDWQYSAKDWAADGVLGYETPGETYPVCSVNVKRGRRLRGAIMKNKDGSSQSHP